MNTTNGTVQINEAFEEMLVSAVRYALGRRTYIVSSTTLYVTFLLPQLSDRTLQILERDIRQQKDYGDEHIDKPEWLGLLNALHKSMKDKDIQPL